MTVRRPSAATAALLAALILTPAVAGADWPLGPTGLPVCVATGEQSYPYLAPDAQGGAFVCWSDARLAATVREAYAQHLTGSGVPLWAADGANAFTVFASRGITDVVADGFGGAILVCSASYSSSDVQLQRLGPTGQRLWGAEGVFACTASGTQYTLPRALVPTGDGGVIVTWWDQRAGTSNGMPYVQKLAANGVAQWATNGVAVAAATAVTFGGLSIVSDGAGGAIVTWDNYVDVFAQRFDAAGNRMWGPAGVAVTPGVTGSQIHVEAAPDGVGGVFLAWWDTRNAATRDDIYGQHLDANGVAQWPAGGLALASGVLNQRAQRLLPDGAGGFLMAWCETPQNSEVRDVVAQRFNSAGTPLWAAGGVHLVSTGTVVYPNTNRVSIASDGQGGLLATWSDTRGGTAAYDVYAQRVSGNGAPLWLANGVLVGGAAGYQMQAEVTTDGGGGAIVAWLDTRSGGGDVYAQHVDASGVLGAGPPVPVQVSVATAEAVAGAVRLEWRAAAAPGDVAVLERRTEEGAWTALATLSPDGLGRYAYEDRAVVAGARYGYRLHWSAGGADESGGEVWVELPAAGFALAPLASPARGAFEVAFSLPAPGPAMLELLDLHGRRLAREDLPAAGAGAHRVTLGRDAPPPSGIYFVRLRTPAGALVRRVVVAR